tara:strand:- start:579 stop:779 length:201 start_codon:yes stop_codon:yes gene_type:complete
MSTEKIFEVASDLQAHQVQVEERIKTVFNRLEAIEKRLDEISSLLTKVAILLITSMGGLIIALILG